MGLCKGTQNLVDGTRQYLRACSGSTVSGGPSMEIMQDPGPGNEIQPFFEKKLEVKL